MKVQSFPSPKYLGLFLDSKLDFNVNEMKMCNEKIFIDSFKKDTGCYL